MKHYILSIFLLAASLTCVNAQNPRNPPRTKGSDSKNEFTGKRWYFGGNLGFTFGNTTYIDVSPFVGYRVTEKFSIGTGIIYNYLQQKYPGYLFKTSLYGGRFFARQQVFETLFLQVEDNLVNGDSYNQFTGDMKRVWFNYVMAGGGFSQPLGGNASINIMALYILNFDPDKTILYPSPLVIRMGFTL